ncbi:glycerophosphodiester phosphodiesterase [Streptomyces gobiensis]|uniref:glycerophosphodiester phosphodiesterase n=1 Tax=Streptomyces gobiensis TaxID=2875706 RepID=UPI001E3D9C92|nr:glycerophosphodiester phosphodiesterase family protein [Streptomyces gobiensis]UGY91079.1 glycerophosphodiester phosphodiesterase [Streptomyces gobiensis]
MLPQAVSVPLIALSLTTSVLTAPTTMTPVTVDTLPGLVYTAHRGGALEVPENSMAGLTEAHNRGSVSVIDFDTRMLSDGTVVVMHDATLERTTDATGAVRELNRADWENVRLIPPPELGGGWEPERPPTAAEVLDRLGGKTVLMLEVKDPDSLPQVAELIRERDLTSSVYVQTKDPEVAARAHRMGLLTGLWRSARQLRGDRPARWAKTVDMLHVQHTARAKDIRRAVRSGIPQVWGFTVDTAQDRDRLLALGCNGIITDAPGLLVSSLGAVR